MVVLDAAGGRVLDWASRVKKGPARDLLCVEATAPAASVFKIVTGAAPAETAGSTPKHANATRGARAALLRKILDHPKRDRWCATLGEAMGRSL